MQIRVAKSAVLLAVIGIFVLVLPRTTVAQSYESLKEASGSIHSLKAQFIQRKYLKILASPLLSEGRLYYRASGSVRWEYLTPLRTVMLFSGETIQAYHFVEEAWVRDLTQAVEVRRMVLAEISQWFQGRFEDTKTFRPSYSPGPPPRITLIPSEGVKSFLNRIDLVFSDRPGIIDYVEIIESGGDKTNIELINVEINSDLPTELFEKP